MSRFKVFRIIIHVAGWLLFMALPLLFLSGGPDGSTSNSLWVLKDSSYWIFCFSYIALFYINVYFLIPRLLLKRKYIQYSLMIVLLFAAVYFLKPFDRLMRANFDHWITEQLAEQPKNGRFWWQSEQWGTGSEKKDSTIIGQRGADRFEPGQRGPGAFGSGERGRGRGRGFGPGGPRWYPIGFTSLFIFILIIALSTASKTVQQWQLTERRVSQAEADKASAELSFLKAQINPHFLFNTLNNIYTLSVTGNEHASDSIMKLSNIMRYVTEEVTDNFVPLQNEIDCISDYIELQKLRVGANTPIEFTVSGNTATKTIAPLVLMTFIENVFKYGISTRNYSPITIKIEVMESGIFFYCENLIFTNRNDIIVESTGIGIKNTRKRLDRLYPGKYLLSIENDNEKYSVNLTLQS